MLLYQNVYVVMPKCTYVAMLEFCKYSKEDNHYSISFCFLQTSSPHEISIITLSILCSNQNWKYRIDE